MKKIFYSLIVLFIVFILSIIFTLNSSYIIQKAADRFSPEYKISYTDITGNIFTGIKVNGLKFKDEILTKNIILSWNLWDILDKKIVIHDIQADALDVDVIKAFIASFSSEDNSSTEPFSFDVIVNKVHLGVKPFEEQGVLISKTVLDVENIIYSTTSLDIKSFSLLLDTNISHIDMSGNMHQDTVTLENLSLKNIDTLALQALFTSNSNNSDNNTSNETVTVVEKNPLIPQYVIIKTLYTDLLPVTYDPVDISTLVLQAEDVKFNISKLIVENGVIDLEGTTNLTNFKHSGKVKDNHLLGNIVLTPNDELYELYKLPIRKEAIDSIRIDFNATKEQVIADVSTKAKQVLIVEKIEDNATDENASKAFNLDIDSLLSHVTYSIKDNIIVADSKAMVSTPYAKDIAISNKFLMDKNMSYEGVIQAKELIGIDVKLTKPLQNLNIQYSGDLESVKTDILSDGFKGSFNSPDFKKGELHIETTKALLLDNMVALPAELNGTKVNAVIDVPLDFENITPLAAKVKITSNLTNLDADIMYGKTLQIKVISNIPEDSLLKALDKNVKWNAIDPLVVNVDLSKKDATLKVRSKALSSDMNYTIESGYVDGKIQLAGLTSTIEGIAEQNITIQSNVNSMESLLDNIQSLYTLEKLPPVKGALSLSVKIEALKQANILLSSPKIVYQADRGTEHIIDDVEVIVSADKSKVQLKSYQVTYNEMKFFSTKPSVVHIKEDTVEISELWLNDELKVAGIYNTITKEGNISTNTTKLHIAHEIIELDSAINIETVLNGEKTSIKGEVTLLGGEILYDLGTKTYPSDSDIIIVQEMQKKEASPFMDNLSAVIKIKTKKPLIYKKGPIDIKAKVELGIHKAEYSELMVLGEVIIMEGGSYVFEGKKFVLDKSHIYFTGNPNKPLLDMSIKYKSLNHLITIGISGTPATPNISFSSRPSLNKEQILSIILFDSEGAAGTNSGEDMMKMMGGAMAKSALSDMGIKLDHLAIGSDGSVEVGKKITDKITFIYVNGIIPEVRVKYQHTPRWESVISADAESESYDIIYKKDF